jgi:type VI secretion system ImpA family protein
LQLAVWLLEAWLHLNGFAGVTAGVTLLRRLCETCWRDLHPAIAADDLEARTSPLTWVNEKLSLKLKTIPLSRPQTGDAIPYSWADWESACRLENLGRKNARLLLDADAEGKVTQATFMGSVMLTPLDFYVELLHDVQRAMEATTALRQLLDSLCGRHAPSLVQYQQTLITIQHLIRDIVQQRGAEVPKEIISFDTESPETTQAPAAQSASLSSSGPIRSRDEAYQRLAEVADYLLKTEPHSPTPYLIKRAVTWGCMPLTELLREVVRDERDLVEIYTLLGVRQERDKT